MVEESFSVPIKEVQLFIEIKNIMSVTVSKCTVILKIRMVMITVTLCKASNSEMDDTLPLRD